MFSTQRNQNLQILQCCFFHLFLKHAFPPPMSGICMIGRSWFDILLRSVLLIGHRPLYKCKSPLLHSPSEGKYKGTVSMKSRVHSKH